MTMQRRVRYDDDDDFDVGRPRRSNENPTSAGMIGFLAAMVSLGLLLVVLVLFIFLKQEDLAARGGANIERTRLMYYWFLILDVVSFFAALTATILGARGSSPTNPLYRGYGVAALVLGIVEMAITVLFGFFISCCGVLPIALGVG
jgi:archaellum biogenesis protein FlaJ (TadC family)